jgi:hypothetical protein
MFKVYSLDNGSLIVVCGKCGYHLVITKEFLDNARKHTIVGEVENLPSLEEVLK